MKRCPECRRDYYDDSLLYCLDDGTALLEGPASNETPTAILSGDTPAGESTRRFVSSTRESSRSGTASGIQNATRSRRTSVVVLVAAVVLIGMAGTGFVLYWFRLMPDGVHRLFGGNDSSRPAASELKIQRLTGDGKTEIAAISPDGKLLANVRNEGGQKSLWIKQIATNSNVQIVAPGVMDHYYSSRFTPDGSYVFFSGTDQKNAIGTIYKVPTLGGPVSRVITNAGHFSFSPDGKQLVFDRYDRAT